MIFNFTYNSKEHSVMSVHTPTPFCVSSWASFSKQWKMVLRFASKRWLCCSSCSVWGSVKFAELSKSGAPGKKEKSSTLLKFAITPYSEKWVKKTHIFHPVLLWCAQPYSRPTPVCSADWRLTLVALHEEIWLKCYMMLLEILTGSVDY